MSTDLRDRRVRRFAPLAAALGVIIAVTAAFVIARLGVLIPAH